MHYYILRRLLQTIPVVLGVTLILFILMFVVPGDPVLNMLGQRADPETIARIRKELGLDKPIWRQYLDFLYRLIQGDLGKSYRSNRPVAQSILIAFPYTFQLAVASICVTILLGISIGLISSVFHGTLYDHLSRIFSLIFISMPIFWFSLVLILVFAVRYRLFPPSGTGEGWSSLWYLVLPSIALGSRGAAMCARLTRASMLEVMNKLYIIAAYAKGVKKTMVIFKHAFRNALLPVVTFLGLNFGDLLTGAVVTEAVFGRPGLGGLMMTAIRTRDFPILQGMVLFIALVFVLANLTVDILYAFIDPRIKYE